MGGEVGEVEAEERLTRGGEGDGQRRSASSARGLISRAPRYMCREMVGETMVGETNVYRGGAGAAGMAEAGRTRQRTGPEDRAGTGLLYE